MIQIERQLASILHRAELVAVGKQSFQVSAPGTVPEHFSVSLLL